MSRRLPDNERRPRRWWTGDAVLFVAVTLALLGILIIELATHP